jgi:uncharacterized protein YbaP (TraB family)
VRRPAAPRLLCLLLCLASAAHLASAADLAPAADRTAHSLWALHGARNTVYLMGSIHVLRASDYPLDKTLMDAYADSASLAMEVNLAAVDLADVQKDMLASALLPAGTTLRTVLGRERYDKARELARDAGADLTLFDPYAPWFVAEAVTQLEIQRQGFEAQSGVEMFFLARARTDAKSVVGLETVQDQIALFTALPLSTQADYLVSSLEDAHDRPQELDAMVAAWRHGDAAWFAAEIAREFGADSALYQSLLVARNRHWLPRIEAMLKTDQNVLVIVGTGHLVGHDGLLDLLQKDGIVATQQ